MERLTYFPPERLRGAARFARLQRDYYRVPPSDPIELGVYRVSINDRVCAHLVALDAFDARMRGLYLLSPQETVMVCHAELCHIRP